MATKPLKSIKFPGLAYTYTVTQLDDAAGGMGTQGKAPDSKAVKDAVDALKEDLTQKANQDGYYADLVSGGATQILSDMVETDTTPYNYRTAGGSLEIGDRMKLKKIVGGSLAVNQQIQNGNFADGSGWTASNGNVSVASNKLTFTLTGKNNFAYVGRTDLENSIVGHKYFVGAYITVSEASSYLAISRGGVYSDRFFTLAVDARTYCAKVFNATASNGNFYIYPRREGTGFEVGSTMIVEDAICHDLTAMFGTTIADYVYSLETATAGAGVAWLKAHFPRIFDAGYIPYNAGTLEHVSGLSAHKMVGFNQMNPATVIKGSYNASAGSTINTDVPTTTASKSGENPITISVNVIWGSITFVSDKLVAGAQYKSHYKVSAATGADIRTTEYLIDDNYTVIQNLGYKSGDANRAYTFTPTTDGLRYACYVASTTAQTVTVTDLCVHLVWDGERDGEYEPYEEHSYPLDSDVTLRGIYKLDANNSLYTDGDEYASDGTVTRRYGIVDLGTLTWAAPSAYGNVYRSDANLPDAVNGKRSIGQQAPIILSTSAFKNSYDVTDAAQVATAGLIGINYSKVYVTFAESMTVAQIKTAMSGVYMLYTLKNEYITTESADPYTEIQNVSNWGTEEFISECLVPVGHETEYQPDLRAKIEVAPESPDTDGLYLMKRENGQNSYVAYLGELPSDPTTDGTYTLKCTVSGGTATKTWEADT